jgi:hypothetical protein
MSFDIGLLNGLIPHSVLNNDKITSAIYNSKSHLDGFIRNAIIRNRDLIT